MKAVAVCKFMLTFIALSLVIFTASIFNNLEFIKKLDKVYKLLIDAVIIFIALTIALPASLAIFDDEIRIKVDTLEEKFSEYKN